jgi:hypothetical protein
MSPILFNIVADMLTLLINRAKIDGVIPHLVDDGLSILQYVDNTIIFLDHTLSKKKIVSSFYVLLSSYRG